MNVTEWFENDVSPVYHGYYEVRNSGVWTRRNKLVSGFVNGRQCRYWDGETWLTEEFGSKSIFGRCNSHQWRGLSSCPTKD